jgi:hypothetical protein
VVRCVTDLAGQIRGSGSRICQDIRVSNLAGRACGFGWAVWISPDGVRVLTLQIFEEAIRLEGAAVNSRARDSSCGSLAAREAGKD